MLQLNWCSETFFFFHRFSIFANGYEIRNSKRTIFLILIVCVCVCLSSFFHTSRCLMEFLIGTSLHVHVHYNNISYEMHVRFCWLIQMKNIHFKGVAQRIQNEIMHNPLSIVFWMTRMCARCAFIFNYSDYDVICHFAVSDSIEKRTEMG